LPRKAQQSKLKKSFEGTKITVVKNEFCGPVIIKVLDSKLVLGRGESMKIGVVEQ